MSMLNSHGAGAEPERTRSETGDALELGEGERQALVPKEFLLKSAAWVPGSALWFENLSDVFGFQFLIFLAVVQHGMKGFANALTGQSEMYLYRLYNVAAPQVQIYNGVTMLPWAMKPVIGLLSDILPIRGYNKGPYITLTTMFGLAALFAIGAVPQESMPIFALVLGLFSVSMMMSTVDLLSEAKYAQKMQASPSYGPDLLSFVWFGMQSATLLAILCSGPVIHYLGPRAAYLIALVPCSLVIFVVSRGYLEERRKTQEEIVAEREKFLRQQEACVLCLLMFLGTVSLSVIGIYSGSPLVNCVASVAVGLVMLVAFSVLLSPVIAKVNAFFLLQTSLGFSIGGASFYFFTDSPEQFPEGPHFSEFFFTSTMGAVGSVFSLLGIYSYGVYMKNWTYRGLLLMTNLVYAVLSLLDLLIFTRYNLELGIPDTAFVLGSSVLSNVVSQWKWMPGVIILSYMCPKGMEATMYALLAGCHNLGGTIASSCGALLLDRLGCKPSGAIGESAQFENLWVASAVSSALPIVTIVLLFWLIPDAHQNVSLVDDTEDGATANSLWRKWRGKAE